MIRTSFYKSAGRFARYIQLDFSKSAVARKIEAAIQEGRASTVDLERLDSGALSLSRLLAFGIGPDQIRRALDSAINKSFGAAQLAGDVSTLLTEWAISEGGEAAASLSPVATIPTAAPASKPTVSGKPLVKGTDILAAANEAYRKSARR